MVFTSPLINAIHECMTKSKGESLACYTVIDTKIVFANGLKNIHYFPPKIFLDKQE